MAFTMCSQPVWTKCRHQPHLHDWPLSVMEGKWSDGWLLAASSQMAAGTALCLADNQRTSKLRQALRPISVQSQEAKGTGQRKETATDKDWGSQKSQQAWKWAALALSFPFACFFCAIFAIRLFFTYIYYPFLIFLFSLLSFFTLSLHAVWISLFYYRESSFDDTFPCKQEMKMKCDGHRYRLQATEILSGICIPCEKSVPLHNKLASYTSKRSGRCKWRNVLIEISQRF